MVVFAFGGTCRNFLLQLPAALLLLRRPLERAARDELDHAELAQV